MKLKVKIKKPNNLLLEEENREQEGPRGDLINKLRRETNGFSAEEDAIVRAYELSLSANNSPVEFFKELGEVSKKIENDLQELNNVFPGLNPLFKSIRNVSAGAAEDIEIIQTYEDSIEDIPLEEASERDQIERYLANAFRDSSNREEEQRDASRKAMRELDFSNLASALKTTGLQNFKRTFLNDVNKAFEELAKNGTDPAEFFARNPDALLDLRTVYHSLNILSRFQLVARKHRSKMAGLYKSGNDDFESIINNVQKDGDQLINNFQEEFKDLRVKELIVKGAKDFNGKILAYLFSASDTATGGKFKKAQQAAKKTSDYVSGLEDAPTGVVEENLRNKNIMNINEEPAPGTDPEYEEAMRELQSDPLTQTFEEYQQQAAEELRQAANDESIQNLSKVAALVIRAFASYKKLPKERRADFAKRFLEKARTDYNEAERQLSRMVDFIKQPLGNLLEKYIDGETGIKEKLIGLRRKVKDAKNSREISPERAASYIRTINTTLTKFAKLRKSYANGAKVVINENPDGYLEFLEDRESWLKVNTQKLIQKLKDDFAQIKSGESPEEGEQESPAEESDPNALKNLPVGKVNVALNQLRQKGISSRDITKQIEDAIQAISRGAGPQRRNFEERDLPVINKIKDELVKILSGDFSNLLKENKYYLKVHNKTYKVINLIASGII